MAKKLYFSSNHDELPIELRSDTVPVGESLTVQSDQDSTDVNLMIARYNKHGILPQNLGNFQPYFTDEVIEYYGDFHQHVDKIKGAEKYFANLPSEIREYFDNSIVNMASWIANPDNKEEAIQLGLLPKPVAPSVSPASEAVVPSAPVQPQG